VYAHFQSKERLFAAVVGRQCQRNARTLVDDDILTQPVEEALRIIGMRFLGILLSPRALRMFRVVAAESYRFPELGKIFFDSGPLATSQALRDYFRLASEREELAVPDPALAAEQFLSVIRGHLHLRCLLGLEDRPPESEMRRLVDEAVTLFCRGYSTHR
jgi:TetR/AcrR family transcriptional repressor of mexJK operon